MLRIAPATVVSVAHAVGLGVSVIVGVLVVVGVFVRVEVSVGVFVGIGVVVPDGVLVMVGVLVAVLDAVGVFVGVAVASASGAYACPYAPEFTGIPRASPWAARAGAARTPAPADGSPSANPAHAKNSRIKAAGTESQAHRLPFASLTGSSLSLLSLLRMMRTTPLDCDSAPLSR